MASSKLEPDGKRISMMSNDDLIKLSSSDSGKKAHKARTELDKRGVNYTATEESA
jgi:hypothetical protein